MVELGHSLALYRVLVRGLVLHQREDLEEEIGTKTGIHPTAHVPSDVEDHRPAIHTAIIRGRGQGLPYAEETAYHPGEGLLAMRGAELAIVAVRGREVTLFDPVGQEHGLFRVRDLAQGHIPRTRGIRVVAVVPSHPVVERGVLAEMISVIAGPVRPVTRTFIPLLLRSIWPCN